MNLENILSSLIAQAIILILSLIGWVYWAKGELKRLSIEIDKLDKTKNAHGSKISELIGSINSSLKTAITPLFHSQSPLTLVAAAQELLDKAEFYNLFDEIKDDLVKELEKFNLETRYDIQEKAREYLQQIRDDKRFFPLKKKAYEDGLDYWTIITAASIPFRDYYLQQHPEIVD